MDLKLIIRERSEQMGFDACRFTSAEAPENAARFERWLERSFHGEMQYLARNSGKRVRPEEVLVGARTIITLASAYHVNEAVGAESAGVVQAERAEDDLPKGTVARYARFADYHDVLGDRLRQLSAAVNELGGEQTRSLWYVDTGPLLERDLAQRAGLGFIGKHTNLINRKLGNWFFLSEIITTLELAPDEGERNLCGSCTRCLRACPTQAIVAPFELDARRCISYLTIELKGSIPEPLRPAIGNRIYGCDDCLAVCPWNRFAKEGALMKPHARPDLDQPDLLELLALDEAEFKRRFRDTPLWRVKRRGLLRNVCVALGNLGDERVLPALERAATDSEPLVAEHAKWAVARVLERLGQRR